MGKKQNLSEAPQVKEVATLPVRTRADVYTVIGLARMMVSKLGFEHSDQIRLETIIVKLAFDMLRQWSGGAITLQSIERPDAAHGQPQFGLEVIVRGHWLGGLDLAQILAGHGGTACLSAVRQLADEFTMEHLRGADTLVRACKWAGVPLAAAG